MVEGCDTGQGGTRSTAIPDQGADLGFFSILFNIVKKTCLFRGLISVSVGNLVQPDWWALAIFV